MEDPWGNNVWSAAHSEENKDSYKEILEPPKWDTFARDEDEDTVDVGVPSWSAPPGSGWAEGTNLWHAESSTLDVWKPSLSIDQVRKETVLEPEDEDGKEQEEDNKSNEARAVLPTPPLSPLPLPSTTILSTESPRSSSSIPLINPPSPDHFGSFESADVPSNEFHVSHFPSEATDEPWGAAWGEGKTEDEGQDEEKTDEWELAQETRWKRDRKVPPELLELLLKQWDEFSINLYPGLSTEHNDHTSWRKGLDSVDGLAELVDSLLPVISCPPPTPFNKTAVAKSVKETLRLTRFLPLTQSSPMAHLHASKGSTDWEKSVKAQKAIANDEWGWDLKHEPEENPAGTDIARDKKSGGLLSFWSRKASDSPTANSPISPTLMSKPTSPSTSTRPSIDIFHASSPTTVTSSDPLPPPDDVDTVSSDVSSVQPSAVSRFFTRFSRKPTAVSTVPSGQATRTSLSLSSDDLSFLSDMTPSTTEGSLQSQVDTAPPKSLGAILSWPTKNFIPTSSKLPPPLAPPPLHSSRKAGHKSTNSLESDTSFDEKIADAQFMDLLDKATGGGPSSRSGYAPVTFDLLESPKETKTPLPVLQSPDLQLPPAPTPPSLWLQPPVTPSSTSRAQIPISMAQDAATVAFEPIPPIPPPHSPDGSSRHRQSITLARFHDPLPPTPKRGFEDLADFSSTSPLSGRSTPPHPPLLPQFDSSPSNKVLTTTSLLSSVSSHSNFIPVSNENDFGDFGDFISTPIRTPSPPMVPQKTPKTTMHTPALELIEKGASRQGRWPAPPSPIPLPLAPPPGPSSNLGYFSMSPGQKPSQFDLLTSDDPPPAQASPSGTSSVISQSGAIPQPLLTDPLSRPALSSPALSTFGMTPAPLPTLSISRTSSPSFRADTAPSKPPGGSGLSAQDLSFFEGL